MKKPKGEMTIFISSVQKELAEDRRAIKAFIEKDPLLKRFFKVFLFEDLPASDSRAHNLPEPDFAQRGSDFTITLWRDWLTAEAMNRFDLNDRQRQAIAFVKMQGRITNRDYREKTGAAIRSASRDLDDLVNKGILYKIGTTGRNTFYVLARKLVTK